MCTVVRRPQQGLTAFKSAQAQARQQAPGPGPAAGRVRQPLAPAQVAEQLHHRCRRPRAEHLACLILLGLLVLGPGRQVLRAEPRPVRGQHRVRAVFALRKKGDFRGAIAAYSEAIALDKNHFKAFFNRGA